MAYWFWLFVLHAFWECQRANGSLDVLLKAFSSVLICLEMLLWALPTSFTGENVASWNVLEDRNWSLSWHLPSAFHPLMIWCLSASYLLWFSFLRLYNASCLVLVGFFFFFPGHNFQAFPGTALCLSLNFLSPTVGRTICFNFIASGHLSCLLEPSPWNSGLTSSPTLPLCFSLYVLFSSLCLATFFKA